MVVVTHPSTRKIFRTCQITIQYNISFNGSKISDQQTILEKFNEFFQQ